LRDRLEPGTLGRESGMLLYREIAGAATTWWITSERALAADLRGLRLTAKYDADCIDQMFRRVGSTRRRWP